MRDSVRASTKRRGEVRPIAEHFQRSNNESISHNIQLSLDQPSISPKMMSLGQNEFSSNSGLSPNVQHEDHLVSRKQGKQQRLQGYYELL